MARLIGYRVDLQGTRLLLFRERKNQFYVEYKGEPVEVKGLYEMVDDGTYNQPVTKVPYIVLDGDVYPIDTFTKVGLD